MTQRVGTHGLFCVDDDDYAAYALAMQCNAQATDAVLTEQAAQLTNFQQRPYMSGSNTTARAIFDDNSSGSIGPEDLVGDIMGAFGPGFTFNDINPVTGGWPLGFYMIGTSINWTVATPNNNTRRMLMVYGVDTVNGFTSSASTYTDLYVATDYEGTTGNVGALTIAGMLHNDGNLNGVQAMFTHQNTGSAINVAIGQWKLWALYLGTGAVI